MSVRGSWASQVRSKHLSPSERFAASQPPPARSTDGAVWQGTAACHQATAAYAAAAAIRPRGARARVHDIYPPLSRTAVAGDE
eukprot:SAG31_NODE_757_length_12296_cov_8.840289_10_plen_83_part_00